MTTPGFRDVTPEQNLRARMLCRHSLKRAVAECADELGDPPISIKQLMARLLIEDFAALDVNATTDWLKANSHENAAQAAGGYDSEVNAARRERCEAFTRLAQAEIAKGQSS